MGMYQAIQIWQPNMVPPKAPFVNGGLSQVRFCDYLLTLNVSQVPKLSINEFFFQLFKNI